MFLVIEGRGPSPELHPPVRARFGAEGGRIGRHPENTLALADPTRQVSRHHAEVRYRAGQFSIKVISETNGILVNDAFLPPGASMELDQGDRLLVGEYELWVHVDSAGLPAHPAGPTMEKDGCFPNIFPPLPKSPQPSSSAVLGELLKDLTPGLAAKNSLPTQNPPDLSLLLGSLGIAPISPASLASHPPAPPQLLQDSRPNQAHVPASSPEVDDIFRTLGNNSASPFDHPSDDNPFTAPLPGLELSIGKDAPFGTEPLSFPSGGSTSTGNTVTQAATVVTRQNTSTNAGGITESTNAVNMPGQVGPSAAQLLRVVSDALELDPGTLDESRPEATLEMMAQLLRLSLAGVHQLLEMRANLKSELGVEDRTTISKAANNPLKHAETLKESITYLTDLRRHNTNLFMPAPDAVEDAMWDICSHELALMAGMRAALLASLKMFSPESVERRIKKSGALDSVIPTLYKSKLWDQFLAMYSDLQREAEDHFDKLLNQEFAKAYADQSKKLRRKGARRKPDASSST